MGYIYQAYNKINGKSYIGQTRRSIQERWNEHCYEESNFDTKLSRAIKKYHLTDWDVRQIEECQDDLLNEREKYWIAYFNSYNNGYNSTLGGEGVQKLNYEAIISAASHGVDIYTISKAYKAKVQTIKYILDANNIPYESKEAYTATAIEMIDPKTLRVIKTFSSITAATMFKPDWNLSTISGAINGHRHSAYGYYWRKVGETIQFKPICKKHEVIQYDKSGKEIARYASIAAANRALGKPEDHKSIGNCLRGKAKTALGYKWETAT